MPKKYLYEGTDFFKNIFPDKSRIEYIMQRKVFYDILRSKYLLNKYLSDRKFVFGIDGSLSGTGVAIINIENGDIVLNKLSSKPKDIMQTRIDGIANRLKNLFKTYPPAFVILEGTFFVSSQPNSFGITKLNSRLENSVLEAGGALYKNVPPMMIKLFTASSGSATKEEMIAAIAHHYGHVFYDHDVADAYAMARMALELLYIIKSVDKEKFNINLPSSMVNFYNFILDSVDKNDHKRGAALFNVLKAKAVDGNVHSMNEMMPQIRKRKLRRECVKLNVFPGADRRAVKKLRKIGNS